MTNTQLDQAKKEFFDRIQNFEEFIDEMKKNITSLSKEEPIVLKDKQELYKHFMEFAAFGFMFSKKLSQLTVRELKKDLNSDK